MFSLCHHVQEHHIYRPKTKFAKVRFLQVSVCPQGVCMVARGRVW